MPPLAIFGWDVTGYVGGSWWAYLVVFAAAALDSILFFLVPSEGVTIAAGVLAAEGRLGIWWVILAAAGGVFVGDNAMYLIGRAGEGPITRRLCGHERARGWFEQGAGLLRRNGEFVIVAGRFVPAGRSAATLASGVVSFPWRRFARADAVAALVWAVYASMLGYLGGQAWQSSFWKPFAVGIGVAALVAGGGELWRRRQRRRGKDVLGKDLDEPPEDGAHAEEPASRAGERRERAAAR